MFCYCQYQAHFSAVRAGAAMTNPCGSSTASLHAEVIVRKDSRHMRGSARAIRSLWCHGTQLDFNKEHLTDRALFYILPGIEVPICVYIVRQNATLDFENWGTCLNRNRRGCGGTMVPKATETFQGFRLVYSWWRFNFLGLREII